MRSCSSEPRAPRLSTIDGRATFRIVLSMLMTVSDRHKTANVHHRRWYARSESASTLPLVLSSSRSCGTSRRARSGHGNNRGSARPLSGCDRIRKNVAGEPTRGEEPMVLSPAENEILTRTGAGTPMGDLFRQFWVPVLLAREIPEPDCPPVRVTVLGEHLLAFRDSANRIGLVEPTCPHRGANLFFGRNEECGIRCAYHGWKFDVAGQCTEIPTMGREEGLRRRVGLTA